MLSELPYILLTLFGIGFIIFIHELGHFLAARAVGVRVEAFSIGFGPRLFGFRRGPTDYKISLIPLGGYVKMAGEDPTRPTTGDPEEFGSKKVWQRLIVISAGVVMNMLFALVAIPIAFSVGIPFGAPVVGSVAPGAPAWIAGIEPGDRIVEIDQRRVLGFQDVLHDFALAGRPVDVMVQRGAETRTFQVEARYEKDLGFSNAGLEPTVRKLPITLEQLDVEKAADDPGRRRIEANRDAGLKVGDDIFAINGIPFESDRWARELQLAQTREEPVTVLIRRDGEIVKLDIPPVMVVDSASDSWWIGVAPLHAVVAHIKTGTTAEQMGLRVKDRILEIEGRPFESWVSFEAAIGGGTDPHRRLDESGQPLVDTYADPVLNVVVERNGQRLDLSHQLSTRESRIDLIRSIALEWAHAVRVIPDSPVDAAGLKSGDVIKAIGDKEIEKWADLQEAVKSTKGGALALQGRRGDQEVNVTITPGKPRYNVGLPPLNLETEMELVQLPFEEAIPAGITYCGRMVERVLQTLRSLFLGNVALKHLGGPITIFQVSRLESKLSLMRGLLFLAIVSINLAILNVLPIPVLDGGWLVFLTIERIKGTPLSERAMGYFQWAGLVFVLGLMAFVTWNDIARLVGWI